MKVSLITVSYNAAPYIRDCIESVLSQSYSNIEYIIIDGNSTDGTQDIIKEYEQHLAYWVSEPDQGIYDAMNKGLQQTTGNITGLLNADDFFANNSVIQRVISKFISDDVGAVFGDLVFVDSENIDNIVRYFRGKGFHPRKMKQGLMPPHPAFFVKSELYSTLGGFDTDFDICADFEFMLRVFCVHHVKYAYIPEILVHMRSGGASTKSWRSNVKINREMLLACKKHHIPTNYLHIYSKYFTKVFQLINRPDT